MPANKKSPIKNMEYWKGKHRSSEKSPLDFISAQPSLAGRSQWDRITRPLVDKIKSKEKEKLDPYARNISYHERFDREKRLEQNGGGENAELITMLREEDTKKMEAEDQSQEVEQAINTRSNTKGGIV